MNVESILPFLLILTPFAIAFFVEALVIYFSRIKTFWAAIGVSIFINLLSLAVLYGSSLLLGKLGYEFNGLRLPLPVIFFLCWLSVIVDGVLLQLLSPSVLRKKIYAASLAMNAISYLFLYFFVVNSH